MNVQFKIKMSRVIAIASVAFLPLHASADEIREFYTGVRQMGMGGAYTGVVNDETSLLTNPAGLGKLRDVTWTIADPELSGSFNDTKVAKLDNFSQVIGVQNLLDALNQQKDTHFNAKAQLFPSLVGPNFGFGIHAKWSYDANVDSATNMYRIDYTSDYAAALGYCLRFFGGIVKLGVAGRAVDRVEVHKDLAATSTALELEALASEGVGVGADVGLIITAPVALLPSLSATVRDAGGTNYTLSNGSRMSTTTRPEPTAQTIDAGLSIFPIISNRTRMALTAEVHDLATLSEETDQMRRLHVGMEFNFSDFFFLRGGLNQRYWTAGFELSSERIQLQFASYGEEIGTATKPFEDRRWVGKFAIRF
jgi:hypothetical protein